MFADFHPSSQIYTQDATVPAAGADILAQTSTPWHSAQTTGENFPRTLQPEKDNGRNRHRIRVGKTGDSGALLASPSCDRPHRDQFWEGTGPLGRTVQGYPQTWFSSARNARVGHANFGDRRTIFSAELLQASTRPSSAYFPRSKEETFP